MTADRLARLAPRVARVALAVLAVVLFALHLAHVFTEGVHWDEFALFGRTMDSLRTGQLRGDGRPGLVTLALLPFVRGCVDAIAVVRRARVLWAFVTAAYLAGFYALLLRARRDTAAPWRGAALGVALVALVPVFLRWSVQVRTDQPALALALWGGVALLASRERPVRALAAGALFAAGYLASQKAAYVGALVSVLALGELWEGEAFERRREALRAVRFAVGAGAVALAYRLVVPLFIRLPVARSLDQDTRVFEFYRAVTGYGVYYGMAPTLAPHAVLLALLAVAAFAARRAEVRARRRLLVAWSVVALGALVVRFHASAFPYFWMTLGLFPATAIALGLEPIESLARRPAVRALGVAAVWCALLARAGVALFALRADTQAVQRDALGFIARNFAPDASGLAPNKETFCRVAPDPFPNFFGPRLYFFFHDPPDAEAHVRWTIDQLHALPVRFVLNTHRIGQLPGLVHSAIAGQYVPYASSVMVPGHTLAGPRGATRPFTAVAPGTFRWMVRPGTPAARIAVDGHELAPGATVDLAAGEHTVALLDDVALGALVLALRDPPRPTRAPFYGRAMMDELEGR